MHDPEKPEADALSDDDDAGVIDDNVLSPRLSTEGTRSKSEQDLARTYSLDMLTVCSYYYYYVQFLNTELL